MATVISAPIRTGKTLYSMQIIDKASKKEPHRRIYTNIIGCSYPGVIMIQSTTNKPFDWRDLPNGSILIYDEAHEHPAFSKDDLLKTYQIDETLYLEAVEKINKNLDLKVKEREELIRQEKKKQEFRLLKAKDDILDIGRSLTLHGHFGIDIYFITQKTYKLNDSVKAATNEHLILRRLFKLKAATIYSFAELQEQFGRSTMKNALNWKFWFYPKQLYKFYISAEEHEAGKKIPASLIFWLVLPLIVFALAIKDSLNSPMFRGVFSFLGFDAKEQQVTTADSSTDPEQTNLSSAHSEKLKQDAAMAGLTPDQYADLQNPEKRNQQISTMQSRPNDMQSIVFEYNASKPFQDLSHQVTYQPTSQPVFAGCMKKNGRYVAYTQQGTILHDVSQDDCRRVIEDGDRPFNYFQQPQQVQQQQTQAAPVNNQMTAEQYYKYLQYLEQTQQAQNTVVQTYTLTSSGA